MGKTLGDQVAALNSDLSTKLGYVRMLTSADDLDGLFANGVYYYPTSSVPQNAPFQSAAIVEVFGSLSPSAQKIQRVTRYGVSGQTAFRPRSDTRWEAWTHGGNSYSLDAAVQIPEGADLNDYATPGNYLCSSAGIAKTLKNSPVDYSGFVLHVERVTGGVTTSFAKQRIAANSSTSEEYWRNKRSTFWTPWQTIAFRSDLEPTLLWSGKWSSGNISVPGLNNYHLYAVELSGEGTRILAFREEGYFRGIGGFVSDTATLYLLFFSSTVQGETLTFIGSGAKNLDANMAFNPKAVISIHGLV